MEMNASVKIRPRWQVNMHMIQERRTRLGMKNGIHMIITAYVSEQSSVCIMWCIFKEAKKNCVKEVYTTLQCRSGR